MFLKLIINTGSAAAADTEGDVDLEGIGEAHHVVGETFELGTPVDLRTAKERH